MYVCVCVCVGGAESGGRQQAQHHALIGQGRGSRRQGSCFQNATGDSVIVPVYDAVSSEATGLLFQRAKVTVSPAGERPYESTVLLVYGGTRTTGSDHHCLVDRPAGPQVVPISKCKATGRVAPPIDGQKTWRKVITGYHDRLALEITQCKQLKPRARKTSPAAKGGPSTPSPATKGSPSESKKSRSRSVVKRSCAGNNSRGKPCGTPVERKAKFCFYHGPPKRKKSAKKTTSRSSKRKGKRSRRKRATIGRKTRGRKTREEDEGVGDTPSGSSDSGEETKAERAVTFDELTRMQEMATGFQKLKDALTPEKSPSHTPRFQLSPGSNWPGYPPYPPHSSPQQQTTPQPEAFPASVVDVGEFLESIHLGKLKAQFKKEEVGGTKLKLLLGPFRDHFAVMGVSRLDVAVLEASMKDKGWL